MRNLNQLVILLTLLILAGCDSAPDTSDGNDPDVPEPSAETPDFSGRWFGIAVGVVGEPQQASIHLIPARDSINLYEATFTFVDSEEEVFGEAEYYPADSVLTVYELVPGVGRRARAELGLVRGSSNQLHGATVGLPVLSRLVLEDPSGNGEEPLPPSIRSISVEDGNIIVAFDQPVELLIDNPQLFDVDDDTGQQPLGVVSAEGDRVLLELQEPLGDFPNRTVTVSGRGVIGPSGLASLGFSASIVHGESGASAVTVSGDYSDSFQNGRSLFATEDELSVAACDNSLTTSSWRRCAILIFQGAASPALGEFEIGAFDSGAEVVALYADIENSRTIIVQGDSGSVTISEISSDRLTGTFAFSGQLIREATTGDADVLGSFEAIHVDDTPILDARSRSLTR